MPEMTLSEAAKWAGVTRPTIHKALVSGRLSGRKDGDGQWRIDPAELERVYPLHKPVDVSGKRALSTPDIVELMAAKDREIALLRELADQEKARATDLAAERDRLLGIVESTTRILTYQKPEMPLTLPREAAPHANRWAWWRFSRRVA
jgi:excisionase family DNA binding protein